MKTVIGPTAVLKAIAYPVTESRVLVPLIVFWLLLSLAQLGGVFGLLLLSMVLPAMYRFKMIVLEARAKGTFPETPGIESFDWWGNVWSLFPLLLSMLIYLMMFSDSFAGDFFGIPALGFVAIVVVLFGPASLAILAITHSPIQSLNPVAIGRLLRECGHIFWLASAYIVVLIFLQNLSDSWPTFIANLVRLLLSFSLYSLVGSLIEPFRLIDNVSIPASPALPEDSAEKELDATRTGVLTHAYSFMSRGNSEGGVRHIKEWIDTDPEPQNAWLWFYQRMTQWDQEHHAAYFAQHAVRDMLAHGEKIPALKLVMRCRLGNEQFRPFPEDCAALAEIAENTGNIELATVLRGG